MTRQQLIEHIKENYGITEDYPWEKDNVSAVFRHPSNKKWFALALNIPAEKLGLDTEKQIDIVNVKCDPLMIGSIIRENGIYPAYHMNKRYWISIALDGSADDEKIKWLLDMSFDATNTKIKAK
ncbi:MAG: MmcQ/YjbR family DNA-binding protein [Oscillospiraceae bacterium]